MLGFWVPYGPYRSFAHFQLYPTHKNNVQWLSDRFMMAKCLYCLPKHSRKTKETVWQYLRQIMTHTKLITQNIYEKWFKIWPIIQGCRKANLNTYLYTYTYLLILSDIAIPSNSGPKTKALIWITKIWSQTRADPGLEVFFCSVHHPSWWILQTQNTGYSLSPQ